MGEWGSTLGLTLLRGKYVLYLKSDVRIKIRHRKILGEHYLYEESICIVKKQLSGWQP